ncbi:MAG: hypothetical protein ACK5LX_03685 [Oscillospiraceae bacterium]
MSILLAFSLSACSGQNNGSEQSEAELSQSSVSSEQSESEPSRSSASSRQSEAESSQSDISGNAESSQSVASSEQSGTEPPESAASSGQSDVSGEQSESESMQNGIPNVTVSFYDVDALQLTPTLLASDADASNLVNATGKPKTYMRYWTGFFISGIDAETIKITDYMDDYISNLLLFETEISKGSDSTFYYEIKESHESPNNAFGSVNEVEDRIYLITFSIDGQKYGCSFSISHDGTHL